MRTCSLVDSDESEKGALERERIRKDRISRKRDYRDFEGDEIDLFREPSICTFPNQTTVCQKLEILLWSTRKNPNG